MNSGVFLYVSCIGLCVGIAFALMVSVSTLLAALLIALASLALLLGAALKYKNIVLVGVCIAALALGVLRTNAFEVNEVNESLAPFAGASVVVEGRIIDDPDRRDTSLHLDVEVEKINNAPARGKLLAILDRNSYVRYGDEVVLEGGLMLPEPFDTDTGHSFDYPGYLRVQGISALLKRAMLTERTAGGTSLLSILFDIKHTFETSVEKIFPEPESSLLEGILLGERRGMPQELTDAFAKSGLIHVVVLSGHNITIVSEGVFRALSFLPRSLNFSLGGVMMILFALMTGAGATTVRALAMALIALLARYMHRSALALRSLAVAAAAMALWNPPALLHDPSFILSVLATCGLIMLSPWVEQKLYWIKNNSVRSIASTTASVQLFILPALLYFTGMLSFLSLPANLLALPVVPFAMLLGFVAGLLGLIAPSLGFAPGLISNLLLSWIVHVAEITAWVPFGATIVPQFAAWIVVLLYVPLTWFAISKYQQTSSR